MSHFTVLVPAKDEAELEAKLLPYHEYECTGIEQYIEFVPANMKELNDDFAKYGNGRTFDEFVADWSGYTKNEQGIYGRITNPNKKWDWWVVGGRWTGKLELLPGATGGSGEPGLGTKPNTNETRADYALIRDIDVEAMKAASKQSALTFAFIDMEGKWNQSGRMGWFGIVTEENADYDQVFWQFWDTLPKEQRVYVVDCHI